MDELLREYGHLSISEVSTILRLKHNIHDVCKCTCVSKTCITLISHPAGRKLAQEFGLINIGIIGLTIPGATNCTYHNMQGWNHVVAGC